jgi:NADH:ubiquinone oxidoreductase 24 kD subunit
MIEIEVCIGTSCHVNGSYNVVQTFQQMIEEYGLHEKVDFKASFCMKQCQDKGVTVRVDGDRYRIEPEHAGEFFEEKIWKKLNIADQ